MCKYIQQWLAEGIRLVGISWWTSIFPILQGKCIAFALGRQRHLSQGRLSCYLHTPMSGLSRKQPFEVQLPHLPLLSNPHCSTSSSNPPAPTSTKILGCQANQKQLFFRQLGTLDFNLVLSATLAQFPHMYQSKIFRNTVSHVLAS